MASAIKRADALSRIRKLLGDDVPATAGDYRWSDEDIYDVMDDGQQMIVNDHPEAQYFDEVANDELVAITATTENLQISTIFRNPFINFVVSRMLIEDSEDAANMALSNNQYARAEKGV